MIKKLRCIKDMYYYNTIFDGAERELGFVKGRIYEVDMEEGIAIDEYGDENNDFDGSAEDWVEEYFVEVDEEDSNICPNCGRELLD